MKKYLILFLFTSLLINETAGQNVKQQKIEFIYNYEVNFLHFIDHLSKWSPYTGENTLKFYEQNFTIDPKDKEMLELYKNNRTVLRWQNEISLFNWARNNYKDHSLDFHLDNIETYDIDTIFQNMKSSIDYFKNKESLKMIMNNRYKKLLKYKDEMDKQNRVVSAHLNKINKYSCIWITDTTVKYSSYPVFICFNYIKRNRRGGANGNGIYAEIDISRNKKQLEGTTITLVHEFLHKLTSTRESIINVVKSIDDLDTNANSFFVKHNITKEQLISNLEKSNPVEKGNNEFAMMDEIIVYQMANVVLANKKSKYIYDRIKHCRKEDEMSLERTWRGVLLLNNLYNKFDDYENEDLFIFEFVKQFYENIYFEHYKLKH